MALHGILPRTPYVVDQEIHLVQEEWEQLKHGIEMQFQQKWPGSTVQKVILQWEIITIIKTLQHLNST